MNVSIPQTILPCFDSHKEASRYITPRVVPVSPHVVPTMIPNAYLVHLPCHARIASLFLLRRYQLLIIYTYCAPHCYFLTTREFAPTGLHMRTGIFAHSGTQNAGALIPAGKTTAKRSIFTTLRSLRPSRQPQPLSRSSMAQEGLHSSWLFAGPSPSNVAQTSADAESSAPVKRQGIGRTPPATPHALTATQMICSPPRQRLSGLSRRKSERNQSIGLDGPTVS